MTVKVRSKNTSSHHCYARILKAEPAEMEMPSLKYREMLQRESLKESLVESEFTKAKRAESDSKVMKANEMPKRIYILDYNDAMVTPIEGDTVYVREDAFVEKAVDYIVHNMRCNGYTLQTKVKFIKGFVNYMKGE